LPGIRCFGVTFQELDPWNLALKKV